MLYADIFILELICVFLRVDQDLVESAGGIDIICCAGDLRQLFDLLLQFCNHIRRICFHIFEQFRNQSILLHQQRQVQVFAVQHLVPFGNCNILAVHNRTLCVLCKSFYIHRVHPQF